MDAHMVSTVLEAAEIPHALGMLSAGNEWAFFSANYEMREARWTVLL